MIRKLAIPIIFILVALSSCNKNEELVIQGAPQIELDSETGIYTVKTNRTVIVSPSYKNVEGAIFSWTVNGKLYSTLQNLEFSSEEPGDYFIVLRVDTDFGSAKEEIKIEVVDRTPPIISFLLPPQGLKVKQNTDYVLTPDIQHSDLPDFSIKWEIDGKEVSTETSYTFNGKELGEQKIKITASNEDGMTSYDLTINVIDKDPYVVSYLLPYYAAEENIRYTYPGYFVYLRPHLEYFNNPQFVWSVDGNVIEGENKQTFAFAPTQPGEYDVTVSVTEGEIETKAITRNISKEATIVSTTVKVICVSGTPKEKLRPYDSSCSHRSNKVYEFTPAPGQFVNEKRAKYSGNEKTMDLACAYAEGRLAAHEYVSLGAWGGFIIVGFDHSIKNQKGNDYDFAVQGNAFATSNEPGIVWVMQDTNGNGLPDDEWYELRGSETGKSTTIQDYEITYFRPGGSNSNNPWIDCFGKQGSIPRNMYHDQEYYYPIWKPESYTIRGTLLPSTMHPQGHAPYQWGYVDNCGEDNLAGDSYDGSGQMNGFKISNAMYPDGTPIMLDYIDFVKVQCAIQENHPSFGEVSTEVFSIEDRNSFEKR